MKYPIAFPVPPPSGFARLNAIEALPIRDKACVDLYRKWLEKHTPRAFAISLQGYCGWSSDNPIAADEAMMFCRQKSEDCRLYAFDDAVVWKPEDAAQDEGGH